jgi:hypothetical protein
MADRKQLSYGGVLVPYTVSWDAEEQQFIGQCPYARMRALRMPQHRGVGRPRFGTPHSDRQREAVAIGLCDLCGKPLKTSTKVSLSHTRWRENAAPSGTGILQVEPLLHRRCAADSCKYCPSLKRDIAAGALMVRQVTSYRAQFVIMSPEFICHYVPSYQPNASDRIVGHAKIELMGWVDRDYSWLGAQGS